MDGWMNGWIGGWTSGRVCGSVGRRTGVVRGNLCTCMIRYDFVT